MKQCRNVVRLEREKPKICGELLLANPIGELLGKCRSYFLGKWSFRTRGAILDVFFWRHQASRMNLISLFDQFHRVPENEFSEQLAGVTSDKTWRASTAGAPVILIACGQAQGAAAP